MSRNYKCVCVKSVCKKQSRYSAKSDVLLASEEFW